MGTEWLEAGDHGHSGQLSLTLSSFHESRLHPACCRVEAPGDVRRNNCSSTLTTRPMRLEAPGTQELDSVFFPSLCGWHVRDVPQVVSSLTPSPPPLDPVFPRYPSPGPSTVRCLAHGHSN